MTKKVTSPPKNGASRALGRRLLRWYDGVARDLPWRRSRDPYRVWVSEVMLQQTQVQTVVPYFEAFVARFPSVEVLAAAALDAVLAQWSGLGYYRRARQLHLAAQEIVARGDFPHDREGWLELPGIGPYTAAAIASIAFSEVVPVLDGNVERVLCRFLAEGGDPKQSTVRRRLSAAGLELLDADRPGDSNQALMELGARLCRPQRPECRPCPLADGCAAFRGGDPEAYPLARRQKPSQRLELAVAVARRDERVLLFRRPDDSPLFAGLWELPNVPQRSRRSTVECELGQRYGGHWRLLPARGTVRHSVTFRALFLHVHPAEVSSEGEGGPEAAWVGPAERGRYAVSSMVEKVLALTGG